MAAPKTMTGARAKVAIVDPTTGQARVIGIFNSVSYGLTYDTQTITILGRFSPAEIVYTAQEAVGISCSGWRVIKAGPHKHGAMPKLADLLTAEYIEMTVIDRQTELTDPNAARFAKFRSVRVTGYSTSINARQAEDITMQFIGLLVDDEDTQNAESPGAADLP